jgi:hypothetical protein
MGKEDAALGARAEAKGRSPNSSGLGDARRQELVAAVGAQLKQRLEGPDLAATPDRVIFMFIFFKALTLQDGMAVVVVE